MHIDADLHIHSRFSGGTSPKMTVQRLATAAQQKGIHLLGTGDCLHPVWREELGQEGDMNNGVITVGDTSFVLTTEIEDSNRVHHLILFPSWQAVDDFAAQIAPAAAALDTAGRPHVATSGATIADMAHDAGALIGPAHAFTPWTAMYAYHDSIRDCYDGATVDFLELGLSADSDYADTIDELHHLPFLSNSDSHSPYPIRLAREFNRLDIQAVTWDEIRSALLHRAGRSIVLNVGFPPGEGKYNRTACTACYRQYDIDAARKRNWRCGCGGRIKKGVRDRIDELASHGEVRHPEHRPPYLHLLPLAEIIGAALRFSPRSKTVQRRWTHLMDHFGSEIAVLIDADSEDIQQVASPAVASAITAFRSGAITIHPGGGGKYGELELPRAGSETKNQRRLPEWN